MDSERWHWIIRAIRSADRRIPRMHRKCIYSDQLIVKLYLWAVVHDRAQNWAVDPTHFSRLFHPVKLPSYSQFCRRLNQPRIPLLLQAACEYLARTDAPIGLWFLDGKPLVISDYSRDRDAAKGHAYGGMRKGYKVHALIRQDHFISTVVVKPLNVGEPNTAQAKLLGPIPQHARVLADTSYDSDKLYRPIAERHSRLLTPLKGRARSPGRLKRMSPARRHAIRLWDRWPGVCQRALHKRAEIECVFGTWATIPGGLWGLPSFVRHDNRVTRWVWAKAVWYHAYLRTKQAA